MSVAHAGKPSDQAPTGARSCFGPTQPVGEGGYKFTKAVYWKRAFVGGWLAETYLGVPLSSS